MQSWLAHSMEDLDIPLTPVILCIQDLGPNQLMALHGQYSICLINKYNKAKV